MFFLSVHKTGFYAVFFTCFHNGVSELKPNNCNKCDILGKVTIIIACRWYDACYWQFAISSKNRQYNTISKLFWGVHKMNASPGTVHIAVESEVFLQVEVFSCSYLEIRMSKHSKFFSQYINDINKIIFQIRCTFSPK